MPQHVANFIRLKRPSTGSFLTYKLPEPIAVYGHDALDLYGLADAVTEAAARILPGWQMVAFSSVNPEKREDNE
jgi:hypothetical protein